MWTIFKVFFEFITIFLLFRVLVSWPRGTWDPRAWPEEVEPTSPALEGEVLTTGPPGTSLIMNSLFWILTFSAQFRWWLQEPPHYSTDHLVGLWTLDTSCNTLPWLCLLKRKATNIQPKPWNLFSGGFMHWTNEFTNLCGFLNCKLLHVRVVNSHASCHIRILN